MSKKITFTYAGKMYTLEYTAESVCLMEQLGFNMEFIESVKDHPVSAAFSLLEGAFLAHHGDLTNDEVHDIVAHLGDKQKLFECLTVMYSEALQTMFANTTGNSSWTMYETRPHTSPKAKKSIKS